MKKFNQFRENRNSIDKELEALEPSALPEDVTSLDETHTMLSVIPAERQNHAYQRTPPQVLIMRRKTVRQFPNGQTVALYYIDKLDKYISIPYEDLKWEKGSSVREEVELEENAIHQLKDIVDNHSMKSIKHKDGSSSKVDVQTANAIMKVHGALNDENKKKIEDMIHHSKEHFGKVATFAWKHVK
jgi:hypothetical protein